MHFCTECGTPLLDSNNICHRCGKKVEASGREPATPMSDNRPITPKTAHIYGISGSTKYLLKGTLTIRGGKMSTLEELRHLHSHYEEIIQETTASINRQYDEIIHGLSDEENRLQQQLQEGIAKQTQEVDQHIGELYTRFLNSDGFFTRNRCRVHYLVALALRNHHIHGPLKGNVRQLKQVRHNKKSQIDTKNSVINKENQNISRSYDFLQENYSFLVGADGEEYVINELSRLPAEYHIINDVNLHFDRAIHWKERNEYIRNCQIDHIVIGPTGIFMLETKNWKVTDIEQKSDKLRYQVRRSSLALWYYLKDSYWLNECPKIFSVVVSMKGSPSGRKPDKYINIVAPHELCRYITARRIALSEDSIHKLVRNLAWDKY